MSHPLQEPFVAYIAGVQVGSYLEADFEGAFGVYFDSPEWRHYDGSEWCWRDKWPTCKCMPLMLAVLYTMRMVPKTNNILIKLANNLVARRLADGCFHEQPEPMAEHRRCVAFSVLIPYQLDLRRDQGSRVTFVCASDDPEAAAGLRAAQDLARQQLRASTSERIRELANGAAEQWSNALPT